MSLDVRVEKVEERHIEKYAALSRTEYGVHAAVAQPEHLRWKYLENPAGPSVGFHLYNGEQLVGRMVAMPRDVIHRGTCYKAAYMADLLVERSFRGMTSLLHIFGGLKSLAGFNLILVTPNAAGAVVWEKVCQSASAIRSRCGGITVSTGTNPADHRQGQDGKDGFPRRFPMGDGAARVDFNSSDRFRRDDRWRMAFRSGARPAAGSLRPDRCSLWAALAPVSGMALSQQSDLQVRYVVSAPVA